MPISTKNIASNKKPVSKTRSVHKELEKHHAPLFKKEGVNYPKFIPRLCYNDSSINEKVIGLYAKEIYGGSDVYIEFCSRSNQPEDPDRTLWKWIYNPEYNTEYKRSEPHPATGDRRYIIPIEELINVSELHSPKKVVKEPIEKTIEEETEVTIEELPDTSADVPFDAMTLRDYVAIQWKKPVSHKKWLNELVKQNQT